MPSLRTRRQTAQLSCPGSAGLYLVPREMPLLLHLLVITYSVMCFCFFSMVLGDELRWSAVLVSAMQIPSSIGSVMAIRIWMYT